jgi:voltage-gated potassium channel
MDDQRESTSRLDRYEARTGVPLVALSLAFLVVYAIPILQPDAPEWVLRTCEVANVSIWIVFAVDLVVRARLSGQAKRYLIRHPIDVALVALPVLRPLRALRIFTAGNVLIGRGKRLDLGGILTAVIGAGVLLVIIGALASLEAERNADGANIRTFGDAIWWAGTTITTVGYGDRYPVTATGRTVAFALMLMGISLLGVITAAVAAWFVENIGSGKAREQALQDEVAELRAQLDALGQAADTAAPSTVSDTFPSVARHERGRDTNTTDAG